MHEQANGSKPSAPLDWKGTARFEVVSCIGRGGMGAVYEAHDRERRQRVALKTLIRLDPASLHLFKQEFRALADVHHRNLVRLYELVGDEPDRVFFSMELVRGVDFLTYVQRPGTRWMGDAPYEMTGHQMKAALDVAGGHDVYATTETKSNERSSAFRRRESPADLDRLRPALRQLVEGIHALHAIRKVHRDIKPSNVLVAPDGRVVILDFGVSTEIPWAPGDGSCQEVQLVGTVGYMAPERVFEDAPTPAADWYSVGVVLYEALVGAPPFAGPLVDVIKMKAQSDATAPSDCARGIPRDLDDLCRALLDRAPGNRPTGPEILRRLGARRVSLPVPAMRSERPRGAALIGREASLHSLREAYGDLRDGRGVTVRVHGAAGMGKSAVVEHFLDTMIEKGEAIVLRGRANERESVPYKAVDGVVDALSRHLMHVDDVDKTIDLPAGIGSLARLFPVLRCVSGIAESRVEVGTDPQRVRRIAFRALRELLAGLASSRPIVVHIDDAQWGDADSAALLLELIRPPFAPAVLFVLGYRDDEAGIAPFLSALNERWPAGATVYDVTIEPLTGEESQRLASSLLGSVDETGRRMAEAIGRESGGSPFLVEELARSAVSQLVESHDAKVTLDDIVASRLSSLPDDVRRLAEIVALGGGPLATSTVCQAAGIDSSDDAIAMLQHRNLAHAGLRTGREVVEPPHERIRETIVARLPPERLQELHTRLARALEAAPEADPEAVTRHLIGAGEMAQGALFAERAAEHAAKQLALEQAARLFRLTIDTLPADSEKIQPLRMKLAQALEWAGRSAEAGHVYLAAAESTPPLERIELERSGSEQLLAAGRIAEGSAVLHRVLACAGVDAPRTPLRAIVSMLLYKLRLRLRGLHCEDRPAEAVAPAERMRLAAMNVAALGLASVDNVLAACMQARQLFEALGKGGRTHILRAAVIYEIHLATRGGAVSTHEREVHALIERLAGASRDPLDGAYSRGTHGVGMFLRGHWRDAVNTIDQAYAKLPNLVAGWQTQASLYALYALAFLGDLVELRTRRARMLADADARGDLFTSVQLRASHPTLLLLASDDPEGARRETRAATALWTQDAFLIQHWQVMRSETEIELYAGEGASAYERLRRDEQALNKSLLLTVQFMRALTAFVRGRAAIASIAAQPERRASRLAEARTLARRLRRERMSWTSVLAAMLQASAESASGDLPSARANLGRAIELAAAAEMSLYAAASRYQLGICTGGVEGATLIRFAEDALGAQEVRDPARFSSMLLPGQWR